MLENIFFSSIVIESCHESDFDHVLGGVGAIAKFVKVAECGRFAQPGNKVAYGFISMLFGSVELVHSAMVSRSEGCK